MASLLTPWIPGDLLLAATAGYILPTPGSAAALHHRPPPVLRRRPWIHSGPASPIFLALPPLDPPALPPSTMSTPPGGKVFPSLSVRAAPSSNSLPVSPAWLQYTPCSLQSARWSLIRGVQCTSPCECGLEEFFRFILDFAYAVLLDPASSAPHPPMWFIHGHLARSPRAGQLCAGPRVGRWTARRMDSGGARAAPHAAPSCTGFAPSAARLALP
ncbi:hypothetical protein VPH35_104559 [Triticum aestivum]